MIRKYPVALPALLFGGLALLSALPVCAQSSTTPPAQNPDAPITPNGKILIRSHGEPPAPDATPGKESVAPEGKAPDITNDDRSALAVIALDLDVRVTPTTAHLDSRARITLRNAQDHPISRVALQVSSALQWQSAVLLEDAKRTPLTVAQHLLDTDADHTGKASELLLTLPQPLAPNAELTLDTFYEGAITASGERLERIGATNSQALNADWDAITPDQTLLRGFPDVLWYPVAEPQLFLGEGNELFAAAGRARIAGEQQKIHLRLSVDYRGEAPVAAYFNGKRQPLKAISDNADAPVASGTGIATAEWPAEMLGFRTPSLFILPESEQTAAPAPGVATAAISTSSSSSDATLTSQSGSGAPLLAVETTDNGSLDLLANSAEKMAPFLQYWLGEKPASSLVIVDHAGQPFEDGPFAVAPVDVLAQPGSSSALAHNLTHAWVQTGQPWVDEGLAEFMAILWVEHEQGRAAALTALGAITQPLALYEPTADVADKPHPTVLDSGDEVLYRRKAAAIWWQLRDLAGDDALRTTVRAWTTQPATSSSARQQTEDFERLLERTSGKDLAWFFNDWIYQDRGLPDLSIIDVTPQLLPAGKGHDIGWLVAVNVRNDGAAAADVPVTIRSGKLATTQRLRINGQSRAVLRVVVTAAPTDVQVNDGSVPELRTSMHTQPVVLAHP